MPELTYRLQCYRITKTISDRGHVHTHCQLRSADGRVEQTFHDDRLELGAWYELRMLAAGKVEPESR